MKALIVTLALTGLANTPDAPRSQVEARASVAADMDGCLDHTIKELGMSAKPRPNERAWNIGPQFLHPSVVPDGAMSVEFAKGTIRVLATWPGALKEQETQLILEERVRAIAGKIAQLCGVIKAPVKCTVTPAKGTATDCAPEK
jgi:hypothetical protein